MGCRLAAGTSNGREEETRKIESGIWSDAERKYDRGEVGVWRIAEEFHEASVLAIFLGFSLLGRMRKSLYGFSINLRTIYRMQCWDGGLRISDPSISMCDT